MNKSQLNPHLLSRRKRAEARFKGYGRAALVLATLALVVLISSLVARGSSGFFKTEIQMQVKFDPLLLALAEGDSHEGLTPSRYYPLMRESLKSKFPGVRERGDLRALYALVSPGAGVVLKRMLERDATLLGKTVELWLPASSPVDLYMKKSGDVALSDKQLRWLAPLIRDQQVRTVFNTEFFTSADSRKPERAGFFGALIGSLLTLVVAVAVVFPLGVATAVYLEEFARHGRFVDIIEVNINNLAAVPSIVFGLLGLSVYINLLHLPRSAPLVGGLTLALMVLPVIIITTRAALKAVPGTIRDAARGLGATPLQVVCHHVLPLSLPGIMTGTILGIARAIGETAPLLMIGMVAFVVDVPHGFTDAATVMPVQIYLWAGSPEAGFAEKTAAGILVLLAVLLALNALAIYIRKKFEVRW